MYQRANNVKFGKSSSSKSKPEGLYDAIITRVVYENFVGTYLEAVVEEPDTSLSVGVEGLVGSFNEVGSRPRVYAQVPRLVAGFEFGPLSFVGQVPAVGDRAYVALKEGSPDNLVLLTKVAFPSAAALALGLNDLTDVEIDSPSEGDHIIYTSGAWTNASVFSDYLPLAGGIMEGDIDLGGNDLLNPGDIPGYVTDGELTTELADYLPLVGGTMSGDIDLDGNDLLGPGDIPGYVTDGELTTALADYLELAGGTMAGDIDMNGNDITNIGNGYLFGSTLTYTSDDTFTKATYPGLRAIRVRAQAGGGAGGGPDTTSSNQWSGGNGGNGGDYVESFILASNLDATEAITVGTGGTGVNNATGNNGTDSVFDTISGEVRARGGIGGAGRGAIANTIFIATDSQASNSTSTGDVIYPGELGRPGNQVTINNGFGGRGGTAHLGRGQRPSTTTNPPGIPRVNYGGGGSGGNRSASDSTNVDGGDGAPGIVLVDLFF